MEIENVLSLFDGISCGQQALNRTGIKYKNYYASEIDQHAIKVTQHNFPNTIQLGSVVDIDTSTLPKIDLLLGGSPCQSFSFAGKRKGMSTKCNLEILTLEHYLELKSEGYEFEGQSYLFWEYMRILKEVNPTYFLLENVMMGDKWEKILSKAIGVNPIMINSALVSAQNRKRLYWSNIGLKPQGLFGYLEPTIQQPKDKGILLKDILEQDVNEKYFLSNKRINTIQKSDRSVPYIDNKTSKFGCLLSAYHKIPTDGQYIVHNTMPRSSKTVDVKCAAMRGRNPENPKSRESGLHTEQMIEERVDNKTNCLTSVQKDNLIIQINTSKESGGKQPYQQNRVYGTEGISSALMAQMSCGTHAIKHQKTIRRLTPIECCRLQTVQDNYFIHEGKYIVSETQIYKQLGNGWTIDVICHILLHMFK